MPIQKPTSAETEELKKTLTVAPKVTVSFVPVVPASVSE
jgi:hypothetical protein